jgi:hypothetical protein
VSDERKLIGPPQAHRDGPCSETCYEPIELKTLTVPEPNAVTLIDLVAQVMAELGVTDPADVLITIQERAAAFRRVCVSAGQARMEADGLRQALQIEREAEELANAELKSIVQRLDAANVDSGGASERVGYALQGMQRGWSTAKELQARLDTVRADRATIKSALDYLKDTVIAPLTRTLGVQHNEEILPAVQVLRAWPTLLEQIEAGRALAIDRQRSRNALTELRIMIQLNRTSVFREAVLSLLDTIEHGL